MKLDSSEKRALAIFSVILGVLLILLVFTVIRWKIDNTQEFSTEIKLEDRADEGAGFNNPKVSEFVTIEKTKSWISQDEDGHSIVGAEYDGTVFNNSGKNIVDWTLTIYMPNGKGGKVSSGCHVFR